MNQQKQGSSYARGLSRRPILFAKDISTKAHCSSGLSPSCSSHHPRPSSLHSRQNPPPFQKASPAYHPPFLIPSPHTWLSRLHLPPFQPISRKNKAYISSIIPESKVEYIIVIATPSPANHPPFPIPSIHTKPSRPSLPPNQIHFEISELVSYLLSQCSSWDI